MKIGQGIGRTSAVHTFASGQINKINLGALGCCSVVSARDKLIEGDGDNGMGTTAGFVHICGSNRAVFGSMVHECCNLRGLVGNDDKKS